MQFLQKSGYALVFLLAVLFLLIALGSKRSIDRASPRTIAPSRVAVSTAVGSPTVGGGISAEANADPTKSHVEQNIQQSAPASWTKTSVITMQKSDSDSELTFSEFQSLSAEFIANPLSRERSARKLLPHLVAGLTIEQVTNILGKPTRKDDDSSTSIWSYAVGYSKMIEIYFNRHGKIEKVTPVGLGKE